MVLVEGRQNELEDIGILNICSRYLFVRGFFCYHELDQEIGPTHTICNVNM